MAFPLPPGEDGALTCARAGSESHTAPGPLTEIGEVDIKLPLSQPTATGESRATPEVIGLTRSDLVARSLRILWAPLLILATVPLLLTEAGLFPIHDLVGGSILDVIFLSHGAFGLAHGHVPYAPLFMTYPDQRLAFLYPPLSLLLVLPPVVAGSLYSVAFSLEILILVLTGSWILGAMCRKAGTPSPVGLLTAVLLLAMGPALLTRVDAVQGLLVAASALALMRRRNVWAVALVGLAVLVKETALLAAVPVGLWCLLPAPGYPIPVRRRLEELGLGLLPALAIFVVFAAWSHGGEVASALTSVHRGLEIESVPASVAILLSHFFHARPYFGHLSSWQVATPLAGLLAGLFSLVGAVLIVAAAVHFTLQHRRPATAISFCVAVGLCATPVLSPQYLLDLLPVLAVAACLEFPARRGTQLIILGLLMALLTQAEFPTLFQSVVKMQPLGVSLLLARNLLLIVVAVLLALPVRRHAAEVLMPTMAAPTTAAQLES